MNKIERFHTLGMSESKLLKVAALNLFHPTASPPLCKKTVFSYCDTASAGRGEKGGLLLFRKGLWKTETRDR